MSRSFSYIILAINNILTLNPYPYENIIFFVYDGMLVLLANAQEVKFVDDAVQGSIGSHQQQYAGTWKHNATSPTFYDGTLTYSNETGAYIMITFVGNIIFIFCIIRKLRINSSYLGIEICELHKTAVRETVIRNRRKFQIS